MLKSKYHCYWSLLSLWLSSCRYKKILQYKLSLHASYRINKISTSHYFAMCKYKNQKNICGFTLSHVLIDSFLLPPLVSSNFS